MIYVKNGDSDILEQSAEFNGYLDSKVFEQSLASDNSFKQLSHNLD